MSEFELRQGDARVVLRTLPEESIHCCITSPPYWGLRDYGVSHSAWGGDPQHRHVWGSEVLVSATNQVDKRRWQHARNGRREQPIEKRPGWQRQRIPQGRFCSCGAWRGALGLEPTPELYVEHLVEVFREVRRVLKREGTLWLNLGDSYFGSWGNYGGENRGHGTQREITSGSKAHQSAYDGLERFRPPTAFSHSSLKPKDLVGIPWRVAFALQADGWYLRSDIIWAKPNPMPESVTDRPTRSHEHIFLLAKAERYYYDPIAIAEPLAKPKETGRRTPARFGEACKSVTEKNQSRVHSGNEHRGTLG